MTDVISISDLHVAYKLYQKPSDMLREALFKTKQHDVFWALRGVSLNIQEGERVGIVGPNGAGKTTLLRVISGNLIPTSGRVSVQGKISSLLSMVPAWNEEMTGIENARFNLAIQGASERQIRSMLEDIADFTELGAFLSRPVKTYSTGMGARLSFAIATALNPEILIIDEVLGTGDGYFAAKAAARMKEFCERGRALLFVSHSTHQVRMMSQKCIWIENGTVRLSGPAETVVRQYEEDMLRKDEATNREGNKARIAKQLHSMSPEDLKLEDLWCLRIRPKATLHLSQAHYVTNIKVGVDDQVLNVPLDIADIRQPDVPAALDTLSCEWGRMFERVGVLTRILTPKIGVRKGGYIWFKRTASEKQEVKVWCSFEHAPDGNAEDLVVDVLNVADGEWSTFSEIEVERLVGGWTRVAGELKVKVPTTVVQNDLLKRSLEEFQRPVEIADVNVVSRNGIGSSLREEDAFKIRVDLKYNEPIDSLNVSINIFRSDGVYVFYQASCFDRVVQGSDDVGSVEFSFDPNPFGAGEFEINTFVTNAFIPTQGPPTEIFDKHIGHRLKIALSRPFDCGLVNTKVPVTFLGRESAVGREAL
ncbi:ABC transporter ATP-binding protein [Bradyrhizobium elkanii]|uniref:ABC transporter ATP-binding protein n=1 Tax=Bradyrhizobium elkanii TaxID=29448 RepID=UPI001AEAF53F|nr:ABC transporter ATP-binding protein [Bradyrhizobium elkanii]MBP2434202.1 lipopolysaccharide transport system ATP-binding protein [Bradyrhizobium elkanii]WLA88887.1 ABC transporter ATP-binding protein [Bradyrhizobium elkanii]